MHHTLSALGLGAVLVCGGWMSAGGAQPPPPGRPLPSPALTNDTAGFAAREEVQVKFHEAAAVMLSGDYTNAIPPLEAVIQAKPSLINAWEALSLCYVRTGRLADAQRLLERLLIIDPTLPRIHKALGQVATMQGDLPGAERYYLSSLKLNPDQYDTRLDLARLLRRQNRPDEALVSLRQLRAEDPQRNDVVLEMAQALLDNQQYAEALPFWQQVAALDQQNEQYQTTIAGVRLHTGFVKEAEEVAQQVLARSSTNLNALLIMADIKEYGDHPAEAVPYLKKIIEVPGYLYLQQQARLRLVMLYVYLHELDPLQYPVDDAIRKAEDFLKEESGNVEMMLMLAELYGVNGQLEQAEKRFRYVLRNFNPHNRRAHNGLFEIYAAQGKLQEAEKELQIVESFNPHNPYRHYTRAQFAAAQGKYTSAYREVAQVEAAGQQGAVAGLL
ncbi:MAG: tetratricopeptide repeat protein, partial [Kiritimatiellaeota bacterium]|nr:tetratricopeptide repeat protein [Kiritimatiellota bacterium]